jgi:hypothetical protein
MGGGNRLLGVVTASMSFHNAKLMGFFRETVLITHAPIVKNGCDCTIRCGDTVGAQELTDKGETIIVCHTLISRKLKYELPLSLLLRKAFSIFSQRLAGS